MKRPILLGFALSACGPSFQEGTYDVTARLERDTCGGAQSVLRGEWDLEESDGDWTIENDESGFEAECDEEDDGSLACAGSVTWTFNGCVLLETDGIGIEPTDDGFEGSMAAIITAMCDGSRCQVDWGVEAELKD